MNNIIYAIYCPIRNQPVYIGKSLFGIERPFEHLKDRSHNDGLKKWIEDLKINGLSPIIVVLEHSIDSLLIDEHERFWVQKFTTKRIQLFNKLLISPNSFNISNEKVILEDKLSNIREFIKMRRKMLKLTQIQCSKKAGVGLRFLRELESGKKDNFNINVIMKLLDFFGGELIVK